MSRPRFWVTLGVATYTIAYHTGSGDQRMASLYGPGGTGNGPLAALPGDLRPDYADYGYTSRLEAQRAADWLCEHEKAVERATGGQP